MARSSMCRPYRGRSRDIVISGYKNVSRRRQTLQARNGLNVAARPCENADSCRGATMTEPAAPMADPLDAARLANWMAGNVAGFAGPLSIERFQGGQSNPTFKLVTPARSYVMRRKPLGTLLPSAHAVDREHRVLAALHPTGFPVPRPLALCEDTSVAGSIFYVMEEVEGRIFREAMMAPLAPADRRSVYLDMAAVLARLHNVAPSDVGLADYGRPGNYMARQLHRWTGQYRASETGRIELMERLIQWLPATTPAQTHTSIVHGDFKLDNVVVHPSEPRLAAVLDWELSTIGDPLADLTYFIMPWVNGALAEAGDLAALEIPSRDECVDVYCRLTGRDGVPGLDWYFSYNLF